MESAYNTKNIFNPRPGFSCYPIRTNDCLKGNSYFRKPNLDQKKVQMKQRVPKNEKMNKIPLPDKSLKRNSINYCQRNLQFPTQTQTQLHTVEKTYKNYRDVSNENLQKHHNLQIPDHANQIECKPSLCKINDDECLDKQQILQGYHLSVLRSKKSYELMDKKQTSMKITKEKNLSSQNDRSGVNQNAYDVDPHLYLSNQKQNDRVSPNAQIKSIIDKGRKIDARIPWSMNHYTQKLILSGVNIHPTNEKNYYINMNNDDSIVPPEKKKEIHSSQVTQNSSLAKENEENYIKHELERSYILREKNDNDYFNPNSEQAANIQNNDVLVKMKNLSPQISNLKESLKNNQRYIAQQKKMKETMKYISLYTTSLRNSKIMNSSRTDLRNKEKNNEYDSDFVKTNYISKGHKIEQDLDQVQTDNSSIPQNQKLDIQTDPSNQNDCQKDNCELPHIRNCVSPKMKLPSIDKYNRMGEEFLKTLRIQKNANLTPRNAIHSPISKMQRCVSEKSMTNKLKFELQKSKPILEENINLKNINKNYASNKVCEIADRNTETKQNLVENFVGRESIVSNKQNRSLVKKKNKLENIKDTSKLSDYETLLAQKPKKPRVPRIRRPRIKIESKDILSANILAMKNKSEAPKRKSCEIKIYREDHHHLDNCKINTTIRKFNEFIKHTFKNKEETYDLSAIKYLGKSFGITINPKLILEKGFKDKTIAIPIKEKLLFSLWSVFNGENSFDNKSENKKGYSKCYKFFVGNGNYSQMIKATLNQRYWWQAHTKEDMSELNFLWTQWKKDSEIDKLPSKTPKPIIEVAEDVSEESENSEGENDEDQNKVVISSKYQLTLNPEQNLPHDSKKLYNRIEENINITSKKYLFINMKQYFESQGENPFDVLPVTFHIKKGEKDEEFQKFKEYFFNEKKLCEENSKHRNVWIIKPGENSNRGYGISVSDDFYEISGILNELAGRSRRTSILQKYIHNPLLINKRKFDIRIYTMVTCYNQGYVKAYYYTEGYLRTSCKEFTLENLENAMIHLTNDAIQKNGDDYGKFEPANKLSYEDFQKYLDTFHKEKSIDFYRDIIPQIRRAIADSLRAVYKKIDPYERANTFEILGYDFMIDEDFKIYLIEVNTNPCLEQCCPLLSRLIPGMIESSFLIGLDPLFLPQEGFLESRMMLHEMCKEIKYELIFDSRIDGGST